MIERIIPSTGEAIPVIGLGTWQTFDVSGNELTPLQQVLHHFHNAGGRLIDSSPMYGRAEAVVGMLTKELSFSDNFFYATKVWTRGKREGVLQMQQSLQKLKRSSIHLMQIHNMVDWEIHLRTLREWKERGTIKYIGITHYTDSMHGALEQIITTTPIDFVQFNYAISNRHAENRLLGAAAEHGVATLINRPFGEGVLFSRTRGKSLPPWAKDWGIESWGQFFLKYIISHPAVTCVIPATGNPAHAIDNMLAGEGVLPDESTRAKMAAFFDAL